MQVKNATRKVILLTHCQTGGTADFLESVIKTKPKVLILLMQVKFLHSLIYTRKKPYEAKIQSLAMIVSLMNLILCVSMFSLKGAKLRSNSLTYFSLW